MAMEEHSHCQTLSSAQQAGGAGGGGGIPNHALPPPSDLPLTLVSQTQSGARGQVSPGYSHRGQPPGAWGKKGWEWDWVVRGQRTTSTGGKCLCYAGDLCL